MKAIRTYWMFFGSIVLGILIWTITYAILPVRPMEPIKVETILFILCCYLALILGFFAFKFSNIGQSNLRFNYQKVIKLVLVVVFLSFLIRWYDLFFIRDLSFKNDLKFNRILNEENFRQNQIILVLASILKSLYFFPFVICIRLKLSPKKLYVIASYMILFFPIVEAVLKGNRKPIFEIFIIVVFTIIAYQKSEINFKKISIGLLSIVFLMAISMFMLFKREKLSENIDGTFYKSLFESRYNEILKPTDESLKYFQSDKKSSILKLFAISGMHTGQYITHGLFEFNHIVDMDNLPIGYGQYNFSTIPKFLNKTNLSTIETSNPSPRGFVYLTFFGAHYLDFRWFTLVFMFLLGILQKFLNEKARSSFIYSPILIYFLIINVFLMILSYTREAGIYPIFGFVFIILLLRIFEKKLYEKGISS